MDQNAAVGLAKSGKINENFKFWRQKLLKFRKKGKKRQKKTEKNEKKSKFGTKIWKKRQKIEILT